MDSFSPSSASSSPISSPETRTTSAAAAGTPSPLPDSSFSTTSYSPWGTNKFLNRFTYSSRNSFQPTSRKTGWKAIEVFATVLPILFMTMLVSIIFVVYVVYHCLPLMQIQLPPAKRAFGNYQRGLAELITFNILAFLLLLTYALAIFISPGSIPFVPEFALPAPSEDTASSIQDVLSTETKRSGERRQCKWCQQYKPDRAHHCRVCRRCVLRMDHHCPWISNCVGWGNHKYFFLSLIYGVIGSWFTVITMMESVLRILEQPVAPFSEMFLLLLAETLASFLALVVSGFFVFHIWLMSVGATTIEFCERSRTTTAGYLWNKGFYRNLCDIFGPNPLLWLLPIDNREGDGIVFVSEQMRLLSSPPLHAADDIPDKQTEPLLI